MASRPLTKAERSVIRRLRALARVWPDSLWLFSACGALQVMRCDKDGNRVLNMDGTMSQKAILKTIHGIPSDGGDW